VRNVVAVVLKRLFRTAEIFHVAQAGKGVGQFALVVDIVFLDSLCLFAGMFLVPFPQLLPYATATRRLVRFS
jgi:hypothetical protein